MNVNEIKQARKELEFSILEQVRGFEAATGMTVESIFPRNQFIQELTRYI